MSFAAQPAVAVQDTGGNTVTGDVSGVTLTITTPAGAALGCTDNGPLAAVAGVATFAGCDIDLASATPYTLHAAATGLGTATSTGITITVGAPAHLVFSTQPSTIATGGTDFAQQPVVTIQDAANNTVTTDTSGVTLTITTPAGAALGCTNNGPVAAVAGVATFAGCDIDLASVTPYTLHAADGALTVATSTGITVATGVPARVAFTTQPSTPATGGVDFATQPVVSVQDAGGNTVTTDTSGVTLTITTPAGAALGCTPDNGPLAAVAGVATFAGCDINLASATPYTLHAADGALVAATSSAITVNVGAASQLAFTSQPSTIATGGTDFVAQPVVTIRDAGGNTVTGNTCGVTLTITTPAGAALSCTPDNGPLAAVAGVATFAGCDIDLASVTPYTLHAADGALTAATSTGITVSTGNSGAARVHDPAQHHRHRRHELRPTACSVDPGRGGQHRHREHDRCHAHHHDAGRRGPRLHAEQRTARRGRRGRDLRGLRHQPRERHALHVARGRRRTRGRRTARASPSRWVRLRSWHSRRSRARPRRGAPTSPFSPRSPCATRVATPSRPTPAT